MLEVEGWGGKSEVLPLWRYVYSFESRRRIKKRKRDGSILY